MKQPFAVSFAARIAGAAALVFGVAMTAGAASPPTAPSSVLFGGGATLPGVAYVGATNAHPDASGTSPRLTTGAADNTAGAVFSSYNSFYSNVESANNTPQTVPTISYCQTGSGAGKKVLSGVNNYNYAANLACPNFAASTGTTIGFGGCTTAPNTCNAGSNNAEGVNNQFGADPAFAASDAPMSLSEYQAFIKNKGANCTGLVIGGGNTQGPCQYSRTEPVQFPVIAGSIAIIYNNSTVPSATQLNISDKDICLIFSGKVTNWNDTRLTSIHGVVGNTSKNIVVAYRKDGSGTTFGFSNHLASVCAAVDPTDFGSSNHFDTSQNFNLVAGAAPTVVTALSADPTGGTASAGNNCGAGNPPTNGTTSPAACFVGGSGNSAVVGLVGGTNGATRTGVDGAIGYAEAANAQKAQAINGVTIKFAKVNGFDPLQNFPAVYTGGQLLLTDQGIDTANINANGTPATTALVDTGANPPPNPNCMWLVDPTTYSNPSGQYPIMAISYLLANNTGNGADANNIARLLTALAVPTLQTAENGIGNNGASPTGFAFLQLTDAGFNNIDPVAYSQNVSHCVQP